jgi:hypothetical protein
MNSVKAVIWRIRKAQFVDWKWSSVVAVLPNAHNESPGSIPNITRKKKRSRKRKSQLWAVEMIQSAKHFLTSKDLSLRLRTYRGKSQS